MKNLAKSATVVVIILLLSKGLGFIREILLAYQFGTSYIVDAYTASTALPSVLFSLFASGFSNAYITVYTRIPDDKVRGDFFNNAVTCLMVSSLILAVACSLFSSQLTHVLAPGFDETATVLLKRFIRIIVIGLPFMTIFSMISAHLGSRESFIFTNFCDFIVINLVIIAAILLATGDHPEVLIYGEAFSWAIAGLLLGLYAWKQYGIWYHPAVAVRDPYFIMLCKLGVPLGASRLINEINGVSDRIFASLLGEGVTSALSYANRVQLIFYTLTTSVFLSVCYPRMNRCFAEGDKERGMYYVRKALMLAAYISIPATCGLFIFAKPVTAMLFQRGSFTEDSTVMTAGCLAFYSLGIPFYALRETAAKALGANMQQRKIMKNTAISVASNILLNLALYQPLGHIGLALATSLTGVIVSALALLDLKRIDLSVFEHTQISDFIKIVAAAAIAVFISIIGYRCMLPVLGNSVAVILAAVVALLVYGTCSVVGRIEIFVWIYQRLPKKIQVFHWLDRS